MKRTDKLLVGVFRKGFLLFTLCPAQTTYERAELACSLFESFDLPLEPGDYIACDLLTNWE